MNNKYSKVFNYIKRNIKNGTIKPGSKLPSIRSLAKISGVNNATVVRAFQESEKEHLTYSIPQRGYFVVSDLSCKTEDKTSIDFNGAITSIDNNFLQRDLQHCFNQAVTTFPEKLFLSNDMNGLNSLREIIHHQLQDLQVFTAHNNIFITTGAQQAIFLLSKMAFPNNKSKVLIEQPAYSGIVKALKLNNIDSIGIERSWNGFDLNYLEYLFKTESIKFFYTNPRFQNPTGFCLSAKQKESIANLAKKYSVYILEDDCLADLDINSKRDPIFSYDDDEKVIYIKSYSKILLSKLRIGSVVLPSELQDNFLEEKLCNDCGSSLFSQKILNLYLKNGMFNNHKKKIKKIYRNRMSLVKDILGSTNEMPPTGYFFTLELPSKLNENIFLESLKKQDIYLDSINDCFIKNFNTQTNLIRLNIRNTSSSDIETGLGIILNTIEQSHRRSI